MAILDVLKANLNEFQTQDIFPLESRGPGTSIFRMEIQGNSILSSVYVKSMDPGATLDVKYFDTTTGTVVGGERYDLEEHRQLTDADVGITDRLTITRIHNKPHCEVTVSGGNVEFGIYITVVASFASDLDAALVLDGEAYRPNISKGIPLACYDEAAGELMLVRCDGDGLKVTGSLSVSPVTTPTNAVLSLPTADTQGSYAIPDGTAKIQVQNRNNGILKYSFNPTGIATGDYWTLFPGQPFCETGLETTGLTIYFESPTAAQTVEILTWS